MFNCLIFLTFTSIFMLNVNVHGKPQEIQGVAIMAFAQAKDSFDTGAVASDKKEFEFLDAKAKNNMEMGVGDAIRQKRSYDFLEEYLIENERFANILDFQENIVNSKEKFRAKRDNNVEDKDNSDYYEDYSSSSSESESNER